MAGIAHDHYSVSAPDGYYTFRTPKGLPPLVTGDITVVTQPTGRGEVGVLAQLSGRENAWNFYSCWITNQRHFGCTRWQDGSPRQLAKSTETSAHIKPNSRNTLSLKLEGKHLDLSVNGSHVGSYMDSHLLAHGTWGVYVASKLGEGAIRGDFMRITIVGTRDKAH